MRRSTRESIIASVPQAAMQLLYEHLDIYGGLSYRQNFVQQQNSDDLISHHRLKPLYPTNYGW